MSIKGGSLFSAIAHSYAGKVSLPVSGAFFLIQGKAKPAEQRRIVRN